MGMSEDKIQLAISRAARAKALLGDDLLSEAFTTLEAKYLDAWRATGVMQTGERERLWQAIHLLGLVRDQLSYVVGDGKIAQAELERLKTLK
jgi:hypothetical protein